MYRKTQRQPTEPLTRRDRLGMAAVGLLVLAAFVGVGIWSVVRPGGYGRSHAGCVTVSAASSTGGALIHECGAGAVTLCRSAFAHGDKLSMLTRPQCRLAGLGPAQAEGAGAGAVPGGGAGQGVGGGGSWLPGAGQAGRPAAGHQGPGRRGPGHHYRWRDRPRELLRSEEHTSELQ